ncbi:MAG: hypothetical protein AAFZ07_16900 [Actinomycetota bacterium]
MTILPGGRPPEPTRRSGAYLLVSSGGGVFPIGGGGAWGSRVDASDPTVGVIAGTRGHAVVRRTGAVERFGPEPPDVVRLGTGLGPVAVVRRLASGWWALHPGLARHVGSGRQVAVAADAVDLAGATDPLGVDGGGRLVDVDGAVLDDPGPLPGDLVGVVADAAGSGWWLVAANGSIVARAGAEPVDPIEVGAYPHPLAAVGPADPAGLVVVTADGRTHARLADHRGGLPRMPASGPIVAISPVPRPAG